MRSARRGLYQARACNACGIVNSIQSMPEIRCIRAASTRSSRTTMFLFKSWILALLEVSERCQNQNKSCQKRIGARTKTNVLGCDRSSFKLRPEWQETLLAGASNAISSQSCSDLCAQASICPPTASQSNSVRAPPPRTATGGATACALFCLFNNFLQLPKQLCEAACPPATRVLTVARRPDKGADGGIIVGAGRRWGNGLTTCRRS